MLLLRVVWLFVFFGQLFLSLNVGYEIRSCGKSISNKIPPAAFKGSGFFFPHFVPTRQQRLLYPLWLKHYSDLCVCSPHFVNEKALKFPPIYQSVLLLCKGKRKTFSFILQFLATDPIYEILPSENS